MRPSDSMPSSPADLLERVYRRGYRIRFRRRLARVTSVAAMVGLVSGAAAYGITRPRPSEIDRSLTGAVTSVPPEVGLVPAPSPRAVESVLAQPPATSRVLIGAGAQANGSSGFASISQNGRFVVFTSAASNLGPGDGDATQDVFLRDVESGRTELVSVGVTGAASSPSITADARYVAFAAGGSVYVRDRDARRTIPIALSVADLPAEGRGPVIAADGSAVAFVSRAPDLVPGDTNGSPDVFVRNFHSGRTELVSVSSTGEQANAEAGTDGVVALSADGRFVVFSSTATNLGPADDEAGGVDVFVRDRVTGSTSRVSTPTSPDLVRRNSYPSISKDGNIVAYVRHVEGGDAPPHDIVLAWNRSTKRESLASTTSAEEPVNVRPGVPPALSEDGRFLAFASESGRVFVRDRRAGTTSQASLRATGRPAGPACGITAVSISGGGGYVAYDCDSSTLVAGDTNGVNDVFVRDRRRSTTVRASVASAT